MLNVNARWTVSGVKLTLKIYLIDLTTVPLRVDAQG